jgi:hypothetical protein
VKEKEAHAALTNGCLILTFKRLREPDICCLKLPGASAFLDDREKDRLPEQLQYACLYWVRHLQRSDIVLSDDGSVNIFLQDKFLYRLEALSLLGRLSEGVRSIAILLECAGKVCSYKTAALHLNMY